MVVWRTNLFVAKTDMVKVERRSWWVYELMPREESLKVEENWKVGEIVGSLKSLMRRPKVRLCGLELTIRGLRRNVG